ncbi:hypothetical protein G3I60_05300 [Streptomyces sp. SID13666]|uniref:IPT/TIG domain-containing protein n=1 Tax=Streptomyces sp. SID13666 TaxID=2706054 RepID=UPI0013C1CB2D|nr:IPT/TIG domain-containing protein [Streptomyces sp. SID13666]NEA53587.1 hypothetical protein [Streptomyces sp. SID13666]
MSGLYKADGTRIAKASFPAVAVADPEKHVTEDIFVTEAYGRGDGRPEGSRRQLLYQGGTTVRQSTIDRLYTLATILTTSPAGGPVAGGTVVTITGTALDGVAGVNFGATAGTNLRIDSSEQIRVTSPAGGAGAVNLVLADDAGTVTKTAGFTYA